MICTNCNTLNGTDSVFCVNCGNAVTADTASSMPTVAYQGIGQTPSQGYTPAESTETKVVNFGQPQHFAPPFAPSVPYTGEHTTKRINPLVWVAGGLFALLALVTVGIYFIGSRGSGGEVLPVYLGMFAQSNEKDKVDEIPKQDFSKVIEAKNTLIKNDSLPNLDAQPNLILYADGKDIPINDLKLIQLDSIKDDGSMKQLDFQVAPVAGKPEMKRIRMPSALANGKYAFSLTDSYFDDGKHKFWAFQVKNSSKSDNGDALKPSSIPLKPTPPAAPRMPSKSVPSPSLPTAPPPNGASMATVRTRIKLRNAPTQAGNNQIGSLNPGTTVYVLEYSSNSEYFNGIYSKYAFVQTPSGQRGWAFAAYLNIR